MKTIPTAKTYYQDNPETIQDIGKGRSAHTERMMIEFAKLHVEACKQKIAKKAEAIYTGDRREPIVSKESILNAYPLSKIV